jgi:hypothetical protein
LRRAAVAVGILLISTSQAAAQNPPSHTEIAAHEDLHAAAAVRAVQAHQADLGAREERQRDVLQNQLAPRIGLGEPVHVIDVLGVRHRALLASHVMGLARLVAHAPPVPQATSAKANLELRIAHD